jgi:ring-1,2-phenylacetyl-CoA epoxidase subunit PaaD
VVKHLPKSSGDALSQDETAIRIARIKSWLDEVRDPEIPALSITDLGIVRDVRYAGAALEVVLTPTYSGCPATKVIRDEVERTLRERGIEDMRIVTCLSPAWTTDWITERGRARLREAGIAPPNEASCPHCGSGYTREMAHFGSTPCKALYRCDACLEPFEYVKPH